MVTRDFAIGNTRITFSLSECVSEAETEQALRRIARRAKEQIGGAEKRGAHERNHKGLAGGGSSGNYSDCAIGWSS